MKQTYNITKSDIPLNHIQLRPTQSTLERQPTNERRLKIYCNDRYMGAIAIVNIQQGEYWLIEGKPPTAHKHETLVELCEHIRQVFDKQLI